MLPKICAITAFISEENNHSPYNIGTLVDCVRGLDIPLTAIANGCIPSPGLHSQCMSEKPVTLIEEEKNLGVPAGWNLGLDRLPSADYVMIVNDDVWFDRPCIDGLVSVFERYPDTAVAGVEGVVCVRTDETGFPKQKRRFGKKKRLFPGTKIRPVSNVSGFMFMLSMKFLAATGFRFDTRYTPAFCEEFDLAFFARSKGFRVRIITGLDDHYDHRFGISAADRTINYLDTSITTRELSQRNMRLFSEKWAGQMRELIRP